jgi:hypothetical protein
VWLYIFAAACCYCPGTPEKTNSIEQRVTDLEKRLTALESIPVVAMALKLNSQQRDNVASSSPTPTPQKDAPLELTGWTYSFHNGKYEFDNRHLFSYSLKNPTQRSIKLVDGSLVFSDLLGEKIMGLQLNRDVIYPAGEVTATSGAWNVNTFQPAEMRLLNIKHEDVKADLIVKKVVFDDNTVWSASQP